MWRQGRHMRATVMAVATQAAMPALPRVFSRSRLQHAPCVPQKPVGHAPPCPPHGGQHSSPACNTRGARGGGAGVVGGAGGGTGGVRFGGGGELGSDEGGGELGSDKGGGEHGGALCGGLNGHGEGSGDCSCGRGGGNVAADGGYVALDDNFVNACEWSASDGGACRRATRIALAPMRSNVIETMAYAALVAMLFNFIQTRMRSLLREGCCSGSARRECRQRRDGEPDGAGSH